MRRPGMQFAHDYPQRLKSLALLGTGPANQALLEIQIFYGM